MNRGRPPKLTLDFFVHDSKASSSSKIRLLSRRHGNDGYATFFRLLETLCQQDGLQLDISNQQVAELTAEDCHLRDAQHLYSIVESCVEFKLLDRQLWESERIVFCPGLYDRYIERLEERRKAAERKKRQVEAKQIAEKISELEKDFSRGDKSIITRDNSELPRDNSPEYRDQNTEYRDQNLTKGGGGSLPQAQEKTPPPPQVKTDPHFGQQQPKRYLYEQPKWDALAPWQTDEQRIAFEAWLKEKHAAKKDPGNYVAVIMSRAGRGEPCPDWEKFTQGTPADPKQAAIAAGDTAEWLEVAIATGWVTEAPVNEFGVVSSVKLHNGYFQDLRAYKSTHSAEFMLANPKRRVIA